MKTLGFFCVLTTIVAVYAVGLRPYMREKPWAQGWFELVEPIEIALYRKSETLLWNRFLIVLGMAPSLMQLVGAFDLTPFVQFMPPAWQPYAPAISLGLSVIGWIGEKMRQDTTKPVDVVALPEVKTPEQEAIVANVEAANRLAIAVVNDAPPSAQVAAAANSDVAGSVARAAVIEKVAA